MKILQNKNVTVHYLQNKKKKTHAQRDQSCNKSEGSAKVQKKKKKVQNMHLLSQTFHAIRKTAKFVIQNFAIAIGTKLASYSPDRYTRYKSRWYQYGGIFIIHSTQFVTT